MVNRKGQVAITHRLRETRKGRAITHRLRETRRKGQVAIFVIVAILIVSGVLAFVLFRGGIGGGEIPAELEGVYSYYLSCIGEQTKIALEIAGTQGGKIESGEYIPGSDFAPFANQLNFLGFPVPYWYYVSGNGVIREQVPTKSEIEREVQEYIKQEIQNCDFEDFRAQGYEVNSEDVKDVRVRIEEEKVRVDVSADVTSSLGESNGIKREHSFEMQSKFGKFYRIATEIYGKQKSEAFLEDYALDVLREYAPVDGVEIQCSPKIWKTGEVVQNIHNGLEGNIGALKFKGNYYDIKDKKRDYFVIDKNVDESVSMIYSQDWPSRIEVIGEGVDDSLIIAEAVGNQEGLGIMGFCYVPYHYVYDVSFPVMIQIYNNEEIFQFPVVVIIDNNHARKFEYSGELDYLSQEDFDLCQYKNSEVRVDIFDGNLNPVDGEVHYECFSQSCFLGESKGGVYSGKIPECVNGYLKVRAEGYFDKQELFSSNSEARADVILDRENEVEVSVKVDGVEKRSDVVVLFSDEDGKSTSAFIPEVSKVKLKEGLYQMKVYVYSNASVTLPASTRTECRDVPRSGIGGIFGGTKEECFSIEIPESKLDYALIGGGKSEEYLLESELGKGKMNIFVNGLSKPNSIEEVQYNYEIVEQNGLEVGFE